MHNTRTVPLGLLTLYIHLPDDVSSLSFLYHCDQLSDVTIYTQAYINESTTGHIPPCVCLDIA
jgi:hypothetical protein